ncbi:hypothetical protein HK101_011429 [Irineochytrium annulatum]|nr:hypothetical protein HK101_011429 [Irineochytrium annulatum]
MNAAIVASNVRTKGGFAIANRSRWTRKRWPPSPLARPCCYEVQLARTVRGLVQLLFPLDEGAQVVAVQGLAEFGAGCEDERAVLASAANNPSTMPASSPDPSISLILEKIEKMERKIEKMERTDEMRTVRMDEMAVDIRLIGQPRDGLQLAKAGAPQYASNSTIANAGNAAAKLLPPSAKGFISVLVSSNSPFHVIARRFTFILIMGIVAVIVLRLEGVAEVWDGFGWGCRALCTGMLAAVGGFMLLPDVIEASYCLNDAIKEGSETRRVIVAAEAATKKAGARARQLEMEARELEMEEHRGRARVRRADVQIQEWAALVRENAAEQNYLEKLKELKVKEKEEKLEDNERKLEANPTGGEGGERYRESLLDIEGDIFDREDP